MKMVVPDEFDAEQPVLEAILDGDRFAFEEFAQRNGSWIRGVVFGVLGDADRVDDVVQQVWTSLWEQGKRLRDRRRWRPWLYRLARNAAVDAGRDQTRRRRMAERLAASAEHQSRSRTPGPGETVAQSERHAIVLQAISSLPALYREPFVLRHLQGWNYRRIADVMDLPIDTVETRLVRARRLLREALKDKV